MDDSNKASLKSWRSQKARRVTRSVLGAEVLAFVEALDEAYILRHLLNDLLGTCVPIEVYTDSKSIFDTVMKANVPQEKRLVIDLASIRENYRTDETQRIGFVSKQAKPCRCSDKAGEVRAFVGVFDHWNSSFDVNEYIDNAAPLTGEGQSKEHSRRVKINRN
uniref:Uncharacterized protein n=1 Tax=Rhodosorus marinus TaxID=101924 RepID=A0A7S0BSR8_9RHOD